MARKKILTEIDGDLWFLFRGRAFNEGKTVRELLEKVIREYLKQPPPPRGKLDLGEEKPKGKSSRFRGDR